MRNFFQVSVIAALVPTAAQASQAWGVVGGSSSSISLQAIDVATGSVGASAVSGGSLAFINVTDLASDPARYPGVVWAVRYSPLVGNELIAVNPHLKTIVNYALINAPTAVRSLAINPVDGVMYGASDSALYTINPVTGSSLFVGSTSASLADGLGFDNAGQLYGVEQSSRFVRVSTTNASTTFLGQFPGAISSAYFFDLAVRPEDGVMYALGGLTGGYQLFTLGLTDGAVAPVGLSLGRPSGLAFTNVPEPSAFGVAAALAGGLAWGRGRRRRQVVA